MQNASDLLPLATAVLTFLNTISSLIYFEVSLPECHVYCFVIGQAKRLSENDIVIHTAFSGSFLNLNIASQHNIVLVKRDGLLIWQKNPLGETRLKTSQLHINRVQ